MSQESLMEIAENIDTTVIVLIQDGDDCMLARGC